MNINDIENTVLIFKDGVAFDSQKLLDPAKRRCGSGALQAQLRGLPRPHRRRSRSQAQPAHRTRTVSHGWRTRLAAPQRQSCPRHAIVVAPARARALAAHSIPPHFAGISPHSQTQFRVSTPAPALTPPAPPRSAPAPAQSDDPPPTYPPCAAPGRTPPTAP